MAGPIVTQQLIQAERERIMNALSAANYALSALQVRCKHPNAKKIPRAYTGNFCKSDDSYWYDCTCSDCGKMWTEDR